MAITKDSWKMMFYGIVSVLLLFGQIRLLTSFGGNLMRLELLGFLVLIAIYVAGLISYPRGYGEKLFFWGFLLYLMNLLAIWLVTGIMSIILLIVALVGFITAIPGYHCNKRCCSSAKAPQELHSQVFEASTTSSVAKTEAKKESKESAPKPSVKFIPGKYVASKSSNVYHEPKCDWAKKIAKDRQVWFASKEDAWEKGYKKHVCVKEE